MKMTGELRSGLELEHFVRTPDAMDLFLYSAAVWLPHRIHYDEPYTTQREGHRGLLVQGPLQGIFLTQLLAINFGAALTLRELTFRHIKPVYVNDPLTCRGIVAAVDRGMVTCELWTELADGARATVAEARLAVASEA